MRLSSWMLKWWRDYQVGDAGANPEDARARQNVSLKPFSPDEELDWSDLGFSLDEQP
jgi:hypothetical protein